MNILGIWDGHDSGAALLEDGQLRFAVNEERLSRRKLEIVFPARSIAACLAHAELKPEQIHLVAATTCDPAKTLGRLWPGSKERYYSVRRRKTPPGPLAGLTRSMKYRMTEWRPGPVSRALSVMSLKRQLGRCGLTRAELRIVDHHTAHAAGAASASGFDQCAVLTIDGLGDGLSATISTFRNGRLDRVAASSARNSIGVFFEHVTNLLNMRELEDEGKVMALADYAAPIADAENPLLPWVRVTDGVIETKWPGHALRGPLARVHWRFPNEQFAYLAQRTVEHASSPSREMPCASRVSPAGAGGRGRVQRQGDATDSSPLRGRGCLRVSTHGRRRSRARRRGERSGGAGEIRPLVSAGWISGRPTIASHRIKPARRRTSGACAGDLPCRVAESAGRRQDRHVVSGRAWNMARAPSATAACSAPGPHRSAGPPQSCTEATRLVSAVLPQHVESDAPRLLADWTGGHNRAMTMAYEVAKEYRRHLAGVMSVDGTCRPQIVCDDDGEPLRNFCGMRAAIGTSEPSSIRASIFMASLSSAHRARQSTYSFGRAPTLWRSVHSSCRGQHD